MAFKSYKMCGIRFMAIYRCIFARMTLWRLLKCQWRDWNIQQALCYLGIPSTPMAEKDFLSSNSLSYFLSPFTTQVYLLSDKGSVLLGEAQQNCTDADDCCSASLCSSSALLPHKNDWCPP